MIGASESHNGHVRLTEAIFFYFFDFARLSRIPRTDGLIDLSVRWMQPIQQHGRRIPSMSSETTLFTWSLRVASCLTEMVQQIHSFRASCEMSSHFASAFGEAESAFFRSTGSVCTFSTPEDIFIAQMFTGLYFHLYRCIAMYMASMPSAKPAPTEAALSKGVQMTPYHEKPRIIAQTIATAMTYM